MSTEKQHIAHVAVLIPDYDDAIAYYSDVLGFELLQDEQLSEDKRWVVVRPRGDGSASLVLAKAADAEQQAAVGNQTGGRVFLFLATDDFHRDHDRYRERGLEFLESPRTEVYGTVAQFRDKFGNKWDLVEYNDR